MYIVHVYTYMFKVYLFMHVDSAIFHVHGTFILLYWTVLAS